MAVLTGDRGQVIQVRAPITGVSYQFNSFWAPSNNLAGLVLNETKPGEMGSVLMRGLIEGVPKDNAGDAITIGDKICTADGLTRVANTHRALYSISSAKSSFVIQYRKQGDTSTRSDRVRLAFGDYTATELAAEIQTKMRAISRSGYNWLTARCDYDSTKNKFIFTPGPTGTNVPRRFGFDWTGANGGDELLAPVLGFPYNQNVALGASGAAIEPANQAGTPDVSLTAFLGYAVSNSPANSLNVDVFLSPGIG